jgi:hypothetical protein
VGKIIAESEVEIVSWFGVFLWVQFCTDWMLGSFRGSQFHHTWNSREHNMIGCCILVCRKYTFVAKYLFQSQVRGNDILQFYNIFWGGLANYSFALDVKSCYKIIHEFIVSVKAQCITFLSKGPNHHRDPYVLFVFNYPTLCRHARATYLSFH